MDYPTFATIAEKIEAGDQPVMELAEVVDLLDFARQRRIALDAVVVGYLNTIVNQASPAGYVQFLEYDLNRFRVVLQRLGKRSSLDDVEP